MPAKFFLLLLLQLPIISLGAQQYWALTGSIHSVLYSVDLDCSVESELEWLVTEDFLQYGSSMTPNGNFYAWADNNDIYQVNTTNGFPTLIQDLGNTNGPSTFQGLACTSNTICYSIDQTGAADTLVEINLVTGTVTHIAHLEGIVHLADLGLFNGDLYYENESFTDGRLNRIILSNPIVQEEVMDLPDDIYFHPMTATSQCHTLLSKTSVGDEHVLINTLDGDLNFIAGNPYWNFGITGMVEFETPACVTTVDLDCDDSSGADEYDYQSPDYYCITQNGVPVCDQDIIFLYDTLIDFVTVELTGSIPDGNLEYLEINSSYPGLTITGSGTQSILIENEGTAASTQFKNAMRAIRYFNDAFLKTLGTRVVRVTGQTYYNTEMNNAIALIEIAPYPAYEPDLGPDTILCDGNNMVLNSNVMNAAHDWSTGETTQMITVTESGVYAVSVSGNEFCPNRDSVEVTFIPSVTVGLANTPIGCAGDEFTIIVEVDSDIPVTITVLSIPGDTIVLTDVSDDTEVPLFINESTYFEILSVTSAQAMCLVIDNSEMDFEVLPTYYDTVAVGICEGDSFLVSTGQYAYQPGYYTHLDNTQFGCDSITTYDVQYSQSIDIYIEVSTCVVADTGLFVQFIDSPSGCDTLLETHIVLGELDTTFVSGLACRTGQEGVFTNTLISIDGCDSVVVQTISLMAPQDTSWSVQYSCDSSELGTSYFIYPNQDGCDSLDILTIAMGVADTTRLFYTSCDPGSIGVTEALFQNQYQCDSLVITTVTMGVGDTTYVSLTSCDSSFLGVHETLLMNDKGCDSLVIETVTYAAKDTTQLSSYTCNPGEAGSFTSLFINQFGCDSIVLHDVLLSPSQFQTMQSGSCFVSDTGTFIQHFINQYGCDSIITMEVEWYPTHSFIITDATCHLADTGTFITGFQNQFGCDSIITHIVNYSPVDTTLAMANTCDELEAGVYEELLTTMDGCDSLVITTVLFDPADISINTLSHFNGYPISCAGSTDGAIEVLIEGNGPFDIHWSTDATESMISGLAAGHYQVTITDVDGCESTSTIQLGEPPALELGFLVTDPGCFEMHTGMITADVSGGVTPYQFSLDSSGNQASATFQHLSGGLYTMTVVDANQCMATEIIGVNQPVPVDVELGDDIELIAGDSGLLQAVVNIPFELLNQIDWSGVDTTGCPDCLTHIVTPFITTSYTITVISDDGCSDRDSVTIVVTPGPDLYIPNIFSPNGDGTNDVFRFYVGNEITRISRFVIFDRWGGIMFSMEDRVPTDPVLYWDGRSKGRPCNPGVYVYQLVGVLSNMERLVRTGTVTLIR